MLLQLNPPLPLQTPDGQKRWAYLVLDYGPEWPTYFLVAGDGGELWWVDQKGLRAPPNVTLDRK